MKYLKLLSQRQPEFRAMNCVVSKSGHPQACPNQGFGADWTPLTQHGNFYLQNKEFKFLAINLEGSGLVRFRGRVTAGRHPGQPWVLSSLLKPSSTSDWVFHHSLARI